MIIFARFWIRIALVLMIPFGALMAESEGQQELLFFLSGGSTYHQITSDNDRQENDFILAADIIYSYLKDDYRFLAEYILSTEESELERFQFGWQADEDVLLWAGRFHSPARYWNSAYHHGQYLQTSISRPLAEKFEDEDGILPTHVTGVMLETTQKLQGADGLHTIFSLGTTSVIGDQELIPFDLLDANSKNKIAFDLRLAYLPDQLGENQIGLLFNWSDIMVDDSKIAEQQELQGVEQRIVGLYLDWRKEKWRVLSNLIYVDNQMEKQSGIQSDAFSTIYFQSEYEVNQDWKIFGRLEDTSGVSNSEYLDLFPDAVIQREMIGLRFDIFKNHALTLEVSNLKTQSENLDQLWLQWSAVLP